MNKLIKYDAVCKRALATAGVLNIGFIVIITDLSNKTDNVFGKFNLEIQ